MVNTGHLNNEAMTAQELKIAKEWIDALNKSQEKITEVVENLECSPKMHSTAIREKNIVYFKARITVQDRIIKFLKTLEYEAI